MVEFIQANGSIATCMAMVIINGRTDQVLRAIILMINAKVMELLSGLTDENMKDNGKRVKCMEKALIKMQMEYKLKEFGLKVTAH
jgi:hypothetical protein